MESSAVNHQSSIINHKFRRAFTLIELLVVISILGILAALTVPALKNFGKSNANISASRQLLDGVAARANWPSASARPSIWSSSRRIFGKLLPDVLNTAWFNNLNPAQKTAATNLCDKQLSGYNFVAYGAMGDQPGQHAWHYLAPWQTLPDGSFIALQKFIDRLHHTWIKSPARPIPSPHSVTPTTFRFPRKRPTNGVSLPYIAFNYLGQLTTEQLTPCR